jgi:HlyD family secretion protein
MMRTKYPFYMWIIILILGMTGCTNSTGTGSGTIQASGFIEGKVYTVASSLGGQIIDVMVEQGDIVEGGDPLVKLDGSQLESAHDQSQAGVELAQASLANLQEKPTNRDVAEAEASLRSAEAELESARAARDFLISSYEPLDPPQSELNTAESAIDVAEASVELAKAQLAQVKAGSTQAEEDILVAQLKEAQANLGLVERQLEDLQLLAITDGVILQVLKREGEIVSPGSPVVYLMDPNNLKLRLYIPVAQVARINIGDQFEITADAYPGETFDGSVTHIADEAQFTPASVLTQEERVKLVFAVDLLIHDPSGKLKPGMPVDAINSP